MSLSIDVIGFGWLGEPLGLALKEMGHVVHGTTTSGEKVQSLNEQGLKARVFQLAQAYSDVLADVAIVNIPSKDISGFKRLAGELAETPVKKVLFVSSTSVYPADGGEVDETCMVLDHPLVEIEQLFASHTAYTTTVLRFSGLIGGSRRPGNFFKNGRVIPNPNGRVNMIHRADCIGLIVGLLKAGLPAEIFNGVADQHPLRSEYYQHVFNQEGRDAPEFSDDGIVQTKLVANRKIKQFLGYELTHPDPMKIMVY